MRRILRTAVLWGLLVGVPAEVYAQNQMAIYNGAIPALGQVICPDGSLVKTAKIATGAVSGSKQAVALTAGKKIAIYGFTLVSNTSAINIKFVEGTGSDCATGATDLTGVMFQATANVAFTSPATMLQAPLITNVVGDALCTNTSGSATVTGELRYCNSL